MDSLHSREIDRYGYLVENNLTQFPCITHVLSDILDRRNILGCMRVSANLKKVSVADASIRLRAARTLIRQIIAS